MRRCRSSAATRPLGSEGAASRRIDARREDVQAILVERLPQHADEVALGTTSAISAYGPVRNPWNLERIAGGSSGGSAAAVSASLCFGAMGTDTGGSIRIPAACCGVVGLKPTYGVVSTTGVIPVSASFDHAGRPMGRTVADVAALFRAMTDHPVARNVDPEAPAPVSRLRDGVFRAPERLCDGLAVDPEIHDATDTAVGVLRPFVAEVREAEEG